MSPPTGHDTDAMAAAVSTGWAAHVILACVFGIAIAGIFMGFYDTVTPIGPPGYTDVSHTSTDVDRTNTPQAVVYTDMTGARFGPNSQWQTPWPTQTADPNESYDLAPATPEARDTINAQRAQRRAYSGAPPVVPHAIDQTNAASCLVCHGQGMKIGTVIAPKMSHETYTNCTQCHVESVNRALPPTTGPRAAPTHFQGLEAPGPGERAWPGAPPTMPHTTWMRENCNSCHGNLADNGLRTSHPWRINCVQCHAPSAELDQWQALGADRPPVVISEKATP